MAEYQAETDRLGEFLRTCCVVGDRLQVLAGDLYKAYVAFQDKNAAGAPMSQTAFGTALTERKFGKRTPHKTYRLGLDLNAVGVAYRDNLPIHPDLAAVPADNVVRIPVAPSETVAGSIYEVSPVGAWTPSKKLRSELDGGFAAYFYEPEEDLDIGESVEVPGWGIMRRMA